MLPGRLSEQLLHKVTLVATHTAVLISPVRQSLRARSGGQPNIESTVLYFGIEGDDAIEIAG
jgi:hypothetical protein